MRRFETLPANPDLPTRYALDEARFRGGSENIRNEEEQHEPSTNFA